MVATNQHVLSSIENEASQFLLRFGSFSLYLNGASIEPVNEVTNLGLTINCSLDWTPHLSIKMAKSYKVFHYIKRTIPFAVSPFVKYNLLNACVLSVLLYGSQVWYPNLAMLRKLLSFHKKIVYWSSGCYEYLKGLEKLCYSGLLSAYPK